MLTHSLNMYALGPIEHSLVSPTADPWVASLILARSHSVMEIDHEIIAVILLPLIQEGLLTVTSEKVFAVCSTNSLGHTLSSCARRGL